MKKVMLMAVAILFSSATVFAANSTTAVSDTTKTKKVKPAKVQYTCTMHPEVLSDKPGKCPKCGMTLVKKEPAKKKADSMKMKM
ncbi:heavy metal-binding domain-containing protein [Mucilaginibacter endophyticus]|uniref:heavy metal-binding domain-containing protein n=1 Tax=Mucilaginibacter endophyticus TaxID=2675003 RepID=UPI000E0DEB93|nr:heavy metal-binding domain-containing protein [Mucilaginibacter endophyticus]